MTFWDIYWPLWLGPLFLVAELSGVGKRLTGKTLSEHVWHWFSVFDRRPLWMLRRVVLFTFLLSLTLHLCVGLHANPWLIYPAIPLGATIVLSTIFERRS